MTKDVPQDINLLQEAFHGIHIFRLQMKPTGSSKTRFSIVSEHLEAFFALVQRYIYLMRR
ncbi:hypothetical protein AWENTII_000409 [Aspergillus wentii]